jgi:DNA-binding Lrp family transcriptional regulator
MLSPDPGIFNRDDSILYFEGEWTRDDARRVLGAPNVVRVGWKVDGGLSVQVWPKSREHAGKEVITVLGRKSSWETFAERPKRSISHLDLIIIDALIDNSRSPLKNLVKVTGLSPKTIRRHLEFLVRNRIISPRPRLGALTDTGELVFQLLVFGKVGMNELRRVMNDVVLVTRMEEPPTKYLFCRGSDLNDVTSKTRAVEKLPGVESVTITLNRELMVATDFLHFLVHEEIEKLERTRN